MTAVKEYIIVDETSQLKKYLKRKIELNQGNEAGTSNPSNQVNHRNDGIGMSNQHRSTA